MLTHEEMYALVQQILGKGTCTTKMRNGEPIEHQVTYRSADLVWQTNSKPRVSKWQSSRCFDTPDEALLAMHSITSQIEIEWHKDRSMYTVKHMGKATWHDDMQEAHAKAMRLRSL